MCIVGTLERDRKGMVLPLFSTCESTDTQEPLAPLRRREIEAQEGSGTCSWSRGPAPAPDPSSAEVPAFREGILCPHTWLGARAQEQSQAHPAPPAGTRRRTASRGSQRFRCLECPARPQEFLLLNQLGFSFTSPGLQPAKATEETQAGRGTNTHQEPQVGPAGDMPERPLLHPLWSSSEKAGLLIPHPRQNLNKISRPQELEVKMKKGGSGSQFKSPWLKLVTHREYKALRAKGTL